MFSMHIICLLNCCCVVAYLFICLFGLLYTVVAKFSALQQEIVFCSNHFVNSCYDYHEYICECLYIQK